MSNAGKYLGPHIQTGPNLYELGPIPINAPLLPSLNAMYMGDIAWGLNNGPRRGMSARPSKLNPLTPFIWDDFIGEHKGQRYTIDTKYTPIFAKLAERVQIEIEQKKLAERSNNPLSPVNAAQKDLEATIHSIESNNNKYQSNIPAAHSLYGLNPIFLMVDLPFRKIYEGLYTVGLFKTLDEIDVAYIAALELKKLSLENNILVNQLSTLAENLNNTELDSSSERDRTASWVGDRLSLIDTEKDLQIQLLPHFLQEQIVKAIPTLDGLTHSAALEKYLTVINHIINTEAAAVKPYKSVNRDNREMKSPMSKPELEALHKLVDLQANTQLGKRWEDYHRWLLHTESVRQLTNTATAYNNLIARAKEAEVKNRENQQKNDYIDSLNFATSINERILSKYGAAMSEVALEMQKSVGGGKIRNFNEAMKTFEKVRINPRAKLNAKDTQAVVAALSALDKATFADNVTRLGKAFGITGKISQANSIREAAITSFETGTWKPLMLELEALAAGVGAGALVAVIFALMLPVWSSTGVGIIFVSVLMAAAASQFDAKSVDKINNFILN